eukprot:CAMPEP_0182419432 /NCGR_PEP_ID=MMETSP1167-20130531/3900_1 /TAXON_ID=2988 /ORGANISM="Mallomonas Sp, Strain CCMP3275" /LENGTH=492 /DNA_ID=CAMNT_0024594369 /DNA_START=58 /DNA_END=1536 /DNA_ORIENTATION=-
MAEMVEVVNLAEQEAVKASSTRNPPKRPDKQELEKSVAEIQVEIEKLQEKVQGIKLQIDKISNDKSGSKGEVDTAKSAIQKLYSEKKQLSIEKAQIMASRDSARATLNARIAQEKQLRGEIKYNSLEAIDNQIKELERRQATMSMTLQDEKKIIKDIKALQLSKKTVSSLVEIKAAVEQDKEATKALEKQYDEKSKAFKNVNDRIAAQRDVLDNLNKDNNVHREVIPGLRQQEKECYDLKNEKFQMMRNLRNDFKKKEDAYYLFLREEKARKQETRQKEIEARKIEEEERKKVLEAEELAKVPYEEEMQLCDYLVTYLQKFTGTDADKETETETGESSGSAAAVDDGGLKVLRRELEDFTNIIVKKRGKKKGGANLKKKDTLAHGVDTIDFFSMLEIVPPSTISGVPASIDAITAKKTYYKTLERGAIPSIADKNKAAKKEKQVGTEPKAKKTAGSGFSLDQDFPTLGVKTKKATMNGNSEAATPVSSDEPV